MGKDKTTKPNSAARELIEWVVTIGVAVVLALAVHTWVGQLAMVDGPSMQPNLWTGEWVVIGKVEYDFKTPKRGDIVLVRVGDAYLIKRVIGLPGDRIAVNDGSVYINGQKLDEPYIPERIRDDMDEFNVPQGYLFLMGDNRNNSTDSRSPEVGPVALDHIVGRAYSIVWPIGKWSKLTGYAGELEK
jgi:signal peptidase I